MPILSSLYILYGLAVTKLWESFASAAVLDPFKTKLHINEGLCKSRRIEIECKSMPPVGSLVTSCLGPVKIHSKKPSKFKALLKKDLP